jgi:tetratricopeptide (TPR) repeat protein
VYHRIIKQDDLRDKLRVAWLREEEWGVTSLLDLLLRIFRALEAEYPDEMPAEHVEAFYDLSPDAAEYAAGALLREIIGDRTLLLFMENLDDLFQGLGDEGQKRLRAYLQDHPFCTILATSQSLFGGVSLQTSPFYGFFRINHLQELDLADAVSLLTKIAKLRNDRALASFIPTPTGRARIRAVQELAGGHPRIYVIFSQFLNRDSLDALVTPFMSMLDDLTPYYQARMAWLSPQQRKIVEFLCDRRHAVPVKEIAQRCFLTHQTASSQLKDLRDKGYARSHAVGRDSYYELREPLMRLCIEVKKNRGEPIRLFVDFLRLWHSRDELLQHFAALQSDAILEKMYVSYALRAIEKESEDPRIAACLRDLNAHLEKGNFADGLQVAEELVAIRGIMQDWFDQGYCLSLLQRYQEALASFDEAIARQYYGLIPGQNQGTCRHDMELYEALLPYDKNSGFSRDYTSAWNNRGSALSNLGRFDEAIIAFDKAIAIDTYNAIAWGNKGVVLSKLGRYEQALMSLEVGIDLGYQASLLFFSRVEALLALNRWEEGYTELDNALRSFAHTEEPGTGDTVAILRNLFTATSDAATQASRIAALVELYDKHQVLGALGQGVVRSIPALNMPTVSDAARWQWRDIWQEQTKDHAELQLPVRLLNAAVRRCETHDPRILLELSVEERKILEEVLKVEEPQEA